MNILKCLQYNQIKISKEYLPDSIPLSVANMTFTANRLMVKLAPVEAEADGS